MENQPPLDEWEDSQEETAEVADHTAETLGQFAAAIARVSQQQSDTKELNHSILQIKDTMAEAIVAFSSLAQSTIQTESRLQAAAEKLESTVERVAVREHNILRELDARVKRFTTLLIWTLLLASFAAAASVIVLLFPFFKAR